MSSDDSPPPDRSRPTATGPDPVPVVFVRRWVRRSQDALATRLGISARDREVLVGEMMAEQEADPLSYWLQLFLAMGIATLGLVLNSTGVVIGAMLISPLMVPIVALGMGLTTGSPFLTLRSSVRVVASVLLVIGTAAVLTALLPFHEVTPEIAGRTSPTLIDLGIATFCALAAALTTVRRSKDTVAAAAGTAIGIALVPPLCVSGFGIGTGSGKVAFGAALLFTANLSSIILFTVLVFFLIGYNAVDVPRLESDHVRSGGRVSKLASRLRRAFTTRYGPYVRFLLPVAFVTILFIPLRRALTEVAWKVRVRSEVVQVLEEVTREAYAVRTALTVEQGQVSIRLVLVASQRRAAEIKEELATRVAAIASTVPTVEVQAVPDYASLQQVASQATTPVMAPIVEPGPNIELLRMRVEERLAKWPRGQDAVLSWSLGFEGDRAIVEVVHVGTAGGDFLELFRETLEAAVDHELLLRERAVPLSTWEAGERDVLPWLPHLGTALDFADVPGVVVCVTHGPTTTTVELPPEEPPETETTTPIDADTESEPEPPAPEPRLVKLPIPGADAADALLQGRPTRVVVVTGPRWSVTTALGQCPPIPR